MPDFNPSDPLDPRLPAPVVRRTRNRRHPASAGQSRQRRAQAILLARRRRAARRACPFGRETRVFAGTRRKRRLLWTACHRPTDRSQG
jgi:hypothetical protein